MDDFYVLQKGKVYEEYKINSDQYVLEHDDASGFSLIMCVTNITDQELKCIQDGLFTMTFEDINDVGMFCFEFDRAMRIDTPFCPNIYEEKHKFKQPEDGQGYILTVLIFESTTGVLKGIRVMGIGHEISIAIKQYCDKCKITKQEYNREVDRIYKQYTTSQLMLRKTAITWML